MKTDNIAFLSVVKRNMPKETIFFDEINFDKDLILLNGYIYMAHKKEDYMLSFIIEEKSSDILFSKGSVFRDSLIKLMLKELSNKEDGDTTLYVIKDGNIDYTFTQKMQIYAKYLEER